MKVKELLSVMEDQTAQENAEMHVILGFEDDEHYFTTWLPYLNDLDTPEFQDRSICSLWFSQKHNTLCLSVSGGIIDGR